MNKDNALRLALEALETLHDENMDYLTRNKLGGENNQCMVFAREAITAIKAALEAKDEPVALKMDVIVVNLVREGINKHRARELAEHFIKHTTTPPQRKPLTDEEIDAILIGLMRQHKSGAVTIARAIEAAHGITGDNNG